MTEQVSLRGVLALERVATGSKSERDAVVLLAEDRHWVLRRAGTFGEDLDSELVELVGRSVTVTGYPGAGVFLVADIAS